MRHCVAINLVAFMTPAPSYAFADPLSPAQQSQHAFKVGYQLQRKNAGFCPALVPMVGLIAHDISAYDKDARKIVEGQQKLGLGLGIAWVAPGSAADRAGLKADDVLEAVGPTSLSSLYVDLVRAKASANRTSKLENWILAKMDSSIQILKVRRASERLEVEMTAEKGCTGAVVVESSNSTGLAWNDNHYIALTVRLLSYLRSDDEIAFVIAHEMGHIWLHEARLQHTASEHKDWLNKLTSRKVSEESSADMVALKAMRHAGFEPKAALGLLSRISKDGQLRNRKQRLAIESREAVLKSAILDDTESTHNR